MTTIHPIDRWLKIYAEQTDGSASEIANRILGDLHGYQHRSRYRAGDAQELAAALEAFRIRTGENRDE